MRTVEFFRTNGFLIRWEARTTDSAGRAVNGVGHTKGGALRHLKQRAANREDLYRRIRGTREVKETREVTW